MDSLKTISIEELQPGMYVQRIVEQRGNLKIKSKGKVTSRAIVEQLKKQGIKQLVIDPSKAFIPFGEEPPEPAIEPESAPVPAMVEKTEELQFDDEVKRAKGLHDKGKGVQKRLLDSVARGLPIDISIPQEFTEQLVGSIDRNPNALMCLTKIREKDSYLLEHSLNVAILLANFAKHLGLPEHEVQELALSGFIHDIGKIKIPDEILHKPGRLTDQEMVIMRDHVYYGIRTLEEMNMPDRIIRTMAEHHERLDGYGYPDGARGDEISYFGRMIAIVDTYDAITADRCYKPGMPSQKALKILLEDAPAKYDKVLVERFIKCVGIYPVGSLVKLNSEHVAMVVEQREERPLKPVVKLFYSTRGGHYVAPKNIDLAASQYKIEKAVKPSDFGIDFNRFFNEKIAI
ncbi:HD-GYP domain-containing protein [Aestuariibacter halophilus]|uniref:HD-GYP domain-containing protein n=1 Tax=Fluctibacter halophilus TaxID=226011 RepID=A0ABS8G936_9ALTE|nr:HD-GYP domain-containing protein [Aestuariibacter halophilus]MCC2616953.1 HD-GYP domain-containing protein [Aestuariibacter halophilus]